MSKYFEVYTCKLDGVIVYIGSGANGRHKHCNSGCSHVYELNKMHFDGVVFDITVKKFNSKGESLLHEKELILKHKPRFNSVYLSKDRNSKCSQAIELKGVFRKELMRYFADKDIIESYNKAFLEYLKHHHIKEIVDCGELKFHERCYYKNNTSDTLFSLYRSYLEGKVTKNSRGYKFFSCVISILNSQHLSKISHVQLYS